MTATEWKSEISRIPEADRYAVEERAAIHEFDGRMERDAAERRTLEDYHRDHGAWWFPVCIRLAS